MRRPIAVGMMRASGKPGFAALAVAHAAMMQGAELIYFTPPDVDLKAEILHGRAYDGRSWRRVKTRLPDVIINDLSSIRIAGLGRRFKSAFRSHRPR